MQTKVPGARLLWHCDLRRDARKFVRRGVWGGETKRVLVLVHARPAALPACQRCCYAIRWLNARSKSTGAGACGNRHWRIQRLPSLRHCVTWTRSDQGAFLVAPRMVTVLPGGKGQDLEICSCLMTQ